MNIVISGGDYMKSIKELTWNELKRSYQPSDFTFQTTNDVQHYENIIGQEKTLSAIKRALQIEAKGFNLYICGTNSDDKEAAVRSVIEEVAKKKQAPDAVVYIYNFATPEQPKLLRLTTEVALAFKDDMEEMIAFILNELPLRLKSEEAEDKRGLLVEEFERFKNAQIDLLKDAADKVQMYVKISVEGLFFVPMD